MCNCTYEKNNGVCTVSIAGRVDSANAAEFEQKVTGADTEEKLILDVEQLEYISSAGLRVILRLRKKHADLELRNASSEVYEILDMTGFTEMMRITKAYRHVSIEGCEVIGQGANGKVYRIDPDTVVKVYINPDSLEDIEHERDVARKALVLGIPTAISYDVVRVGDCYASMFELLNAKSFSKLLAAHPENIDEYAKMYIDLLQLIHSTEVPAGQLPDQWDSVVNWVTFLQEYLPADIYNKLYNMITAIPRSNHMIHGDYHTKNIMLQNEEVILIDMDTLAVGHPVLELGGMYNAYIGFSLADKTESGRFLGIPDSVAPAFWRKSLALYFGTEDENELQLRENQAAIVGLVRLLRRTIRRKGDPVLLAKCREELCRLVKETDTLI